MAKYYSFLSQKKCILATIIIILALPTSLLGQKTPYFIEDSTKFLKWDKARHEVNLSVGILNDYRHWVYPSRDYELEDNAPANIMNNRMYKVQFISPAFTFEYSYRFFEWLSVGAVISYAIGVRQTINTFDNSVAATDHLHYMAIAPEVRFDWLHRNYVTLYSGVAVGVGYWLQTFKLLGGTDSRATYYADLTLLGLKVGKRWYGLLEFSWPRSGGAIKVGLGYRFQKQK